MEMSKTMTELEQIMAAADAYAREAWDDGWYGSTDGPREATKRARDALQALIKSLMDDRERALSIIRIRQMGELL